MLCADHYHITSSRSLSAAGLYLAADCRRCSCASSCKPPMLSLRDRSSLTHLRPSVVVRADAYRRRGGLSA
ncbi:uncharacterized protein BROUX77_006892 [Berkeleyomyces rouxiae]|uniref:uncharacterized protein n=1 Tax=Berkeleyomyces rouxiae TaxID=2035830 RepID=UPI003B7777A4